MIYHGINQGYKNVFRLFWGCTAYLEEHAADSCWWIKWVLCPTFYFDNQVNMYLLFTTKSCLYHGCLVFVESRAHCFFDLWGNIWIGMNHSFTEPFPSTFADVWWQPKGAAGSLPIRSAMAMKKKENQFTGLHRISWVCLKIACSKISG